MGLKLNLGCGLNVLPGHINVDKYGTPELKCDLEVFPWPWQSGSVSEIVLNHVLEHLGATPEVFIGIMKEMYRVSEPDAQIHINVPNPRHDHFIGDPTHVRAITPAMLQLFSRQTNLHWQKSGCANTPLALYHDVDFEIVHVKYMLDDMYYDDLKTGKIKESDLEALLKKYNNVASEIRIQLRVVKSPAQ